MSRKFIVGIVFILVIIVSGFAFFILQKSQPRKVINLETLTQSLSNPQIANTFVIDESISYVSLRGILTSKSSNEIKIIASTGGDNISTYQITEKTRLICLEKRYENSWLDFHEILDNRRVLDKYPELYVQKEIHKMNASGTQQVLFSKSKDIKYPDILWVIGCNI